MKSFLLASLICALGANALSQDSWQSALSKIPLNSNATELNRTNCVALMLGAFQSNGVVKAIVFMPGSTDELYFFRRVHAGLTNVNPSLLDAVTALTNQTYIQATFRPPLLLLHTTEDFLDGFAIVKNEATAKKLHEKFIAERIIFNDADWDALRARVNHKLSIGLRPFSGAAESWHFFRHDFVACGVSDWEMLEAIALAGKTTFAVNWRTATFAPDTRHGITPRIEIFPPR
jgi:hypothetical protein